MYNKSLNLLLLLTLLPYISASEVKKKEYTLRVNRLWTHCPNIQSDHKISLAPSWTITKVRQTIAAQISLPSLHEQGNLYVDEKHPFRDTDLLGEESEIIHMNAFYSKIKILCIRTNKDNRFFSLKVGGGSIIDANTLKNELLDSDEELISCGYKGEDCTMDELVNKINAHLKFESKECQQRLFEIELKTEPKASLNRPQEQLEHKDKECELPTKKITNYSAWGPKYNKNKILVCVTMISGNMQPITPKETANIESSKIETLVIYPPEQATISSVRQRLAKHMNALIGQVVMQAEDGKIFSDDTQTIGHVRKHCEVKHDSSNHNPKPLHKLYLGIEEVWIFACYKNECCMFPIWKAPELSFLNSTAKFYNIANDYEINFSTTAINQVDQSSHDVSYRHSQDIKQKIADLPFIKNIQTMDRKTLQTTSHEIHVIFTEKKKSNRLYTPYIISLILVASTLMISWSYLKLKKKKKNRLTIK